MIPGLNAIVNFTRLLTLPSNAVGFTGLHRINPPIKWVESTGFNEHTHKNHTTLVRKVASISSTDHL